MVSREVIQRLNDELSLLIELQYTRIDIQRLDLELRRGRARNNEIRAALERSNAEIEGLMAELRHQDEIAAQRRAAAVKTTSWWGLCVQMVGLGISLCAYLLC